MKERKVEIYVKINGIKELANLSLISTDKRECFLQIFIPNNYKNEFSGTDFFDCFAKLRKEKSDIIFLCKGAKLNVYPSGMARDMALGMASYELILGKKASRENLVGTFDFEDNATAITPNEQKEFFNLWLESIK